LYFAPLILQVGKKILQKFCISFILLLRAKRGDFVKIYITQKPDVSETEINIACKSYTDEIAEIISNLSLIDGTIGGKLGDETYFVKLSDILYFESVDDKIFFCTKDNTYETPMRLYKIEEKLAATPFSRISKSVIANLKKVRSIKIEAHGRLLATLHSGEKLLVSRQYVPEIKKKLGV